MEVAGALYKVLAPFCNRIEIAGSLRRKLAYVGDIEILYIPKLALAPQGFFEAILNGESPETKNMADYAILQLVSTGILAKRKNVNGSEIWGESNKLAVHVASGIPVDLFATTLERWAVSLVIRTGGKQTNIDLAMAAKRQGLKLHPYGDGYTNRRTGEHIRCRSETDVFSAVGLRCVPPSQRK